MCNFLFKSSFRPKNIGFHHFGGYCVKVLYLRAFLIEFPIANWALYSEVECVEII